MCDITPIKSFQPWKIDVVDKSLNYAKDREARKIALTFSSAYATIKEWDYLVSKREQVQGFDQGGEVISFDVWICPTIFF